MRRGYFYLIIIAVIIGVSLYGFMGDEGRAQLRNMIPFRRSAETAAATVRFDGVTVTADVASSAAQQSKGLSGRTSLAADTGMLFVFSQDASTAFWMKDMRFPIDIIWINDDTVVDLDADVPIVTSGSPPLYTPVTPVNYVLEVNAGFAAAHGIAIGSAAAITVDPVREY